MPAYKTTSEIGEMTAEQRLEYLLEQWSMSSPIIVGILKRNERGDWWLEEVRDSSGRPLLYPIAGLREYCSAAYLGRKNCDSFQNGLLATAEFQLAPSDIQEQKNNPLLINARAQTVRALLRIPPEIITQPEDGVISVDQAIFQAYLLLNDPKLMARRRDEELRVVDLQNLASELVDQVDNATTERDRIMAEIEAEGEERRQVSRKELSLLGNQIAELAGERDRILAEIEADYKDERRASEDALAQAKAALAVDLALATELQTAEMEQLRVALDAARLAQAEEELTLMNQNEQLREYVRDKAGRLLALDFITQDQYDELQDTDRSTPDERTAGWPTLTDIEGGYAGLISRVQRYLYVNERVYPKTLLRTFHALMLTGDFVILAGLSGSGKTMLVKSFAEATGNVSHIIPVKPNWTSAEDLTGYYNPLQSSYLTTPFLDAVIAAKRDSGRLHLICLDEMNLARVEYYFADFLSALEERSTDPTIELFSDDEAGHVRTEFKLFLDFLLEAGAGRDLHGFGDFLRDREIAQMLKDRLGIHDGESMLQMHARLRRMVAGVFRVPPQLRIPPNVRFVGTVNMDATTHFLSPKVLDRAHVIQFQSPLNYWDDVAKEVKGEEPTRQGVIIPAAEFPREPYPPYEPKRGDKVSNTLREWSTEYLDRIGIEIGLRLIRQSLAFRAQCQKLAPGRESDAKLDAFVLNNLLRQKLLPRFSFDGKHRAKQGTETIAEVVERFYKNVAERLPDDGLFSARGELRSLIDRAKANDGIFNYWS